MTEKIWSQKNASSLFSNRTFTVEAKQEVAHQTMMGMVIAEGWAPKRYQGLWGRWIKASGITPYDLERLIAYAKSLEDFCPRGFTRNRLKKGDWHKFDLPKLH